MIIGIGTDILDIRRIQRIILKYGRQFEERIYTPNELKFARKRKLYIETLAKMYSLKESVIKAISTVSGIRWHNIEIVHDENGKPLVELSGQALKTVAAKFHNEKFNISVSVSDEIPYVCSFAIISN
ncbi:MAG: holo-ACP synthase [Holosporales bacterium]|jgi:holo-[acyl-carrier protein] synthase|nr:holo-ACP synthase [Holosporales bacterium]